MSPSPSRLGLTSNPFFLISLLPQDHATGQLLFKPQHAPRRWALQVLPITTLLTDQAGVACLSLIHGPRIMDFTARSPLDASLVFRMTATDMLNQGAHVRCGPHQRHRCLSVQRTAVYGQWVVRAHPSDRVIAQLDKDPGLRRSLRVKGMWDFKSCRRSRARLTHTHTLSLSPSPSPPLPFIFVVHVCAQSWPANRPCSWPPLRSRFGSHATTTQDCLGP